MRVGGEADEEEGGLEGGGERARPRVEEEPVGLGEKEQPAGCAGVFSSAGKS